MTAPDRTTWTVTEDSRGDQTLWHGETAVLRQRIDIETPDEYEDLLWDVLTRVLAPDEATLMELDRRVDSYAHVLDDPEQVRWCVEDVLDALAGTSAQARHTDDHATGGGAKALADAWDAGFEAGASWTPSTASGIPIDPPVNPYQVEVSGRG